jgi:hypothetical protein
LKSVVASCINGSAKGFINSVILADQTGVFGGFAQV